MRCYCDNPGGSSTLKTKYGNVKLKPRREKREEKEHERKEKTSTTETRVNGKVKIHFERVGEKKSS